MSIGICATARFLSGCDFLNADCPWDYTLFIKQKTAFNNNQRKGEELCQNTQML